MCCEEEKELVGGERGAGGEETCVIPSTTRGPSGASGKMLCFICKHGKKYPETGKVDKGGLKAVRGKVWVYFGAP